MPFQLDVSLITRMTSLFFIRLMGFNITWQQDFLLEPSNSVYKEVTSLSHTRLFGAPRELQRGILKYETLSGFNVLTGRLPGPEASSMQ